MGLPAGFFSVKEQPSVLAGARLAFQVFDGRLWKNNGYCGKINPENVGGPILWNKNLIYVKFSPWMLCTTKQLHEASYLLELCLSISTICILVSQPHQKQ